jgi:spermidine synthase
VEDAPAADGQADGAGADGARTSVLTRLRPAGVALTDRHRLALASFLMLFVELALIRWTASNVVYLVHLTNFVLLASFLGIGIGFLRGKAARDMFPFAPVALAVLVGFVLLFPVAIVALSGPRQIVGLHGSPPLPRWASLSAVFLLTVAVMALLAEEVARTFARFEPLEAYRLDIMGSLAGIAAFAALSFLRLPPLGWAVLVAVALVLLLGRRAGRWQYAGVAALLLLLGAQSLIGGDHWSPYYKVHAITHDDGSLEVSVNNVPHQTAYSVERMKSSPTSRYHLPYTRVPSPEDVLIIGAGTGNDVAVALDQGARRVDAVEIDPVLQRLGRDHHPNRPYADPRVNVHIDDGRAFTERTNRQYDLIILALTDSATIVTGQSALRLENYLFTTEALTRDRSLLKPGGTFAMYNYYEPWLLDRYAGTITSVYGTGPCVQLSGEAVGARLQAVLTISKDASTPGCTTNWQRGGAVLSPATDDRPFPYLAQHTIPSFYLWMLALILLAALVLIRVTAGPIRQMRPYLDLAFMGAAFLLLETKNVVQFALLFGTTWFVNAAVFAGVLLSVLAAVEVARRVTLPRPQLLYGGLLAALALAWLIPPAALLDLAVPLRFLAGVAIAFAPIFVANLVFAQRFRNVSATAGQSTVAFGANLLGAMVGGALEYLALIAGYRFLLLLVAVLYGLAFLTGRRHLRAAAA